MSDPMKPAPEPTLAGAPGSAVDLAKRIPFRMVMHMNLSTEHLLDYLNEPLNIACCVTTKYRNGKPGKAVREFGINEQTAKSYKTLAALLEEHPEIAAKAAALYPPNTQGSATAEAVGAENTNKD